MSSAPGLMFYCLPHLSVFFGSGAHPLWLLFLLYPGHTQLISWTDGYVWLLELGPVLPGLKLLVHSPGRNPSEA